MKGKLIVAVSLALALSANVLAQKEFRHVSTAAGFDVSLVIPDGGFHPTVGWGGLMSFGFSLGNIGEFHIFPNIEFWVSSDQRNNNTLEVRVFEMMINGDFRYYFPFPEHIKVRPYIGNGFAFVTTFEDYDYDFDPSDFDDTDLGMGFNFLAGIDIPFSLRTIGFTEMKGKLDSNHDVFKFTFGMKFLL